MAKKVIYLFDRRAGDSSPVIFDITGVKTYTEFKRRVATTFDIAENENFVICTLNRENICDDSSFDTALRNDVSSITVLQEINQDLPAPTEEKIEYLPHYDTLLKSGMYEYYASAGQDPLPYALAELIDNSLMATAHNKGCRKIELRLHLDPIPVIFVIDNGCGMTASQLKDWAVYRLSKFHRKENSKQYSPKSQENFDVEIPRSLNSEISYFGVGGKQAIFYLGQRTRMITKPRNSKDVHEFSMSQDDFEKKEQSKASVYSGLILSRRAGDASHISPEEEYIRKVILEEVGEESFTCVVIQEIVPDHVTYLKQNYENLCRELAHTYHYYIHGPKGNILTPDKGQKLPSKFKITDIEVKMYSKGHQSPKVTNLRDVIDDLETQFIRTAASCFEFRGLMNGKRVVEGLLRYHPFLYDHETYPYDPYALPQPEDENDSIMADTRPGRGNRPMFECFWNGRLIPYTTIDELPWCATPKKVKDVPVECYNRVSGVLWTDDSVHVTTNKQTFIDLERQLLDKNTNFVHVVDGQLKRGVISKEFQEWLKTCNEQYDKQVMFRNFHGYTSRSDVQKHKQYPWAMFYAIEWDGRVYKKGQLVRTQRTNPIIIGKIEKFLLFGEHSEDVFATGGDMEIKQEPSYLYSESKIYPLAKLDRKIGEEGIKKIISDEEEKLPDKLTISWPEGNEVKNAEKIPVGKLIGPIKAEVLNKRGESISKLPGSTCNQKKLLVELQVLWHSQKKDVVLAHHIGQHAKNWPYWFLKMDVIQNLGPHTLSLQVMLNGDTTLGSRKELPSYKIRFTVIEAEPEKFTVGLLDGPFRVGLPFQIPLEFYDKFGNPTKPKADLKPQIEAVGVELKYEDLQVKGNSLIIKGIKAKGTVENSSGKSFQLAVKIPTLEEPIQTLKIRLHPGVPEKLKISPKSLEIENGSSPSFEVMTVDAADNITSESRLAVECTFHGPPDSSLPVYSTDLSAGGKGVITGPPLHLNLVDAKKSIRLKARFCVPDHRLISVVEGEVLVNPSHHAASLVVGYRGPNKNFIYIERDKDISWVAGQSVSGLEYRILDEAGREIDITPKLAGNMKVNWTKSVSSDILLEGKLPDIQTPQSIKQLLYCNVTLSDNHVIDFPFTIKPRHGEPAYLKATCSGTSKVRIGEALQADILVTVADKYGNAVKKVPFKSLATLAITAEGLDYSSLEKALGQSGGFVFKGLKFSDGQLGSREVCVQWNNLKDYFRLEIVAGPPAKIIYPGFDTSQIYIVYNDSRLPSKFVVQLCDSCGNPTPEENVKIMLGLDTDLKITPTTTVQKTDKNGQADFGILTVAVRGSQKPGKCPLSQCSQKCRGVFSICAKGSCGRVPITGPLLKIHMPCNLLKPVEIKVDYDQSKELVPGMEFPVFSVHLITEDGGIYMPGKASQICMKLWQTRKTRGKSPVKPVTLMPSDPSPQDDPGMFYFRNKLVPKVADSYSLQFIYDGGSNVLASQVIPIVVPPGLPVKLVPREDPGIPTVTNTQKPNSRLVVKHLVLELRDEHDNLVSAYCKGTLNVQITNFGSSQEEIPKLAGNVTSIQVPFDKGQAILENLMIQEKSPGIDGKEYIIRCTAVIDKLSLEYPISPYDVYFLFYNDIQKQAQMANLAKEHDSLVYKINTYKSLFDTTQQYLKELEAVVQSSANEENKIRNQLQLLGDNLQGLNSSSQIMAAINKCKAAKEQLEQQSRRECKLHRFPPEPGVLGKIGHLAWVSNVQVARVLAWHMQGDMDCLVTLSKEKALEIHRRTAGQQQLLPLDSVFKRNLPDWNRPLPHVRIKSYNPPGNPLFARQFLVFGENEDICRIVFGMLLGDAIILDTLEDAVSYRDTFIKNNISCPTLLTKTGERIRNNGKFGGASNKAPPMENLVNGVFGEPPLKDLEKVDEKLELLQSLKNAVDVHQQAKKDYFEQQKQESSSEMVKKVRDYQITESRLRAIEEKLGMLPSKDKLSTPETPESQIRKGNFKNTARESTRRNTDRISTRSRSSSPHGHSSNSSGQKRRSATIAVNVTKIKRQKT
ncbi:structural maintenance of chromosomes flexible hinge domain-containing protein 1-like isoform X1 [Limulus polyphemus]|uniref:Structural maintenance of chromosomes flexible hinge domain-containing protein 1-like isoform X1 n=1 Tax=Limulus polyphemus TaxID=6850 RepID=A0ABM1B2Q2_LIMPO|nr:structural maintenance of chromosomes flexible hinge domain-containing protein 1-like isoform X1 [Limulus polyphemus]